MQQSFKTKINLFLSNYRERIYQVSLHRYILLCVIIASLFTFFKYIGCGVLNQIEQLPIILRAIDPDFLVNDFFTNSSDDAIARSFYAHFIGFLSGTEQNLPFVMLLLTLLSNIILMINSFLFGKHLFKNSSPRGLISAILVMSVSTFTVAETLPTILANYLIPSAIALPFLTLGIYFATKKKLIMGVLLSGIGSLIHPLLGLEGCALLLAAYLFTTLMNHRKLNKGRWQQFIISAVILLIFAIPQLLTQFSQTTIDADQFIHIIAYFRHPHHYLPSQFPVNDILAVIVFYCVFILIWLRTRSKLENFTATFILVLLGLIELACIGGYVFVEVFPSRLWVIGQVFRFQEIVKWLGLCLFPGYLFLGEDSIITKPIYFLSLMNPFSTGGCVALNELHLYRKRKNPAPSIFIVVALSLITISLMMLSPVELLLQELILAFLAFIISGLLLYLPDVKFTTLITVLISAIFIFQTLITCSQRELSTLTENGQQITAFAKTETPEKAIFLTPPLWGEFRISAKRAIVVDLKSFLFTDAEMAEWYNRIVSCYGASDNLGWDMLPELEENYSNITDEKLLELQQEYGINYAVLYLETITQFEILYQNEEYKIAIIQNP